MKVIKILVIWFSLPVIVFAVLGFQHIHGSYISVDARQVIKWTEVGPVPAGQFFPSIHFEWGNPLTWGYSVVLSQVVMRLTDFVLLSLPGFFAWLFLELIPDDYTESKRHEP